MVERQLRAVTMTKLMLGCVAFILVVSNVIGSEAMKKQKYVPYRATPDEISLTNAYAAPFALCPYAERFRACIGRGGRRPVFQPRLPLCRFAAVVSWTA